VADSLNIGKIVAASLLGRKVGFSPMSEKVFFYPLVKTIARAQLNLQPTEHVQWTSLYEKVAQLPFQSTSVQEKSKIAAMGRNGDFSNFSAYTLSLRIPFGGVA
jgi:hypothetical protein